MSAFNLFKNSTPSKKSRSKAAKAVPTKSAERSLTGQEPQALDVAKVSNTIITPVSVVLHPYVSEKATRLEGMNQYMFKVTRTANKPEVKKAIQNRYKVTVVSVNMINMPSKKRTVGRYTGTKAGYRKAIVTLAEGDSINSAKA